jgi:hypothetical protein
MTDVSDDLMAARAAFERHEWSAARAGLAGTGYDLVVLQSPPPSDAR